MKRVLLVAATTGYQVREFSGAAEALGIELVLATDRCHILTDPWGDEASALRFEDPAEGIEALAARGPFDGILAVGDRPAYVAAQIAARFGLRFHSAAAAQIAGDKLRTRECFRAAGMRVPGFQVIEHGAPLPAAVRYPCVIKPIDSSGSRGVIRADNVAGLLAARERIGHMWRNPTLLVEDFIPGREFALDGLVTAGKLRVLALFDKPDALDGPFFEETIYVTPSREPELVQHAIGEAAQAAVTALGLSDGPVHAEMRVNDAGVWMLEVAARPIGGLCARVLRFETAPSGHGSESGDERRSRITSAPIANAPTPSRDHRERFLPLEEILLRHTVAEDVSQFSLAPGAHAVMMIPIPAAGAYRGVQGLESASRVPGIEAIEITAKEGQILVPLPEGASYMGFIFARAASPAEAEHALREAHARLVFDVSQALPIVR